MRFVHGLAAVFVLVHTSMAPAQDDPRVQNWLQQLGTREEVRFQALDELVKLGEKSIEPTRQLLNDKDEPFTRRWQAAKVLGKVKAQAAVPDLVTVVEEEDENYFVKMAAVEALRIIGDGSVVPRLKWALTQEQDANIIRSIRQAIAALDDTPGDVVDPESQELLNALGPVQPVETGVRHRLGDEAFERAIEMYRRVLKDKIETVPRRSHAATVLGKLSAKAAVPDLLDIVEDDESPIHTRVFAALALARIGDWEAVPRLEKAVAVEEDATLKLRIRSVVAKLSRIKLMELGDDVDADVLRWLKVLGTEEPAPFQALNELIKLGEKSIDPARIVLSNKSELYTRRWQAAKALGALKAERAMPELLTVVEGDDHRVVKAVAAEALGRIGDGSVLPRLENALEEERDPYIRSAIEQAIKALNDA